MDAAFFFLCVFFKNAIFFDYNFVLINSDLYISVEVNIFVIFCVVFMLPASSLFGFVS